MDIGRLGVLYYFLIHVPAEREAELEQCKEAPQKLKAFAAIDLPEGQGWTHIMHVDVVAVKIPSHDEHGEERPELTLRASIANN